MINDAARAAGTLGCSPELEPPAPILRSDQRGNPLTSCSTASPARSGSGPRSPPSDRATLALANKESLSSGRSSRPLPAGPDRPGRLRAFGDRAGAALRRRSGGRPARADGVRRPVPRPHAGVARRGHARRGARPPHVGHGPRRHDELRDPRQQGPRGDRGAPAVRRPATTTSTSSCTRSRSCTRWSSSSTARRSPRPRRPTCGCRSRSVSTGRTGRGRRCADRLDARGILDLRAARRGAFPAVALAKRVGRAGRTYPAVFNAANEQAVMAFHAGQMRIHRHDHP